MKKIIFTLLMATFALNFAKAQDNGILVQFSGNKPNISDYVTAVLQQEEIGEALGAMANSWEKHLKGQPIDDGCTITVDTKNGYVRYDATLEEENQHNFVEFCYWNCTDGQHKLVAYNVGVFVNGEYVETELTGVAFMMYTDKTKRMKYAYSDELGDEVTWPKSANLLQVSLPRVGKSIKYVFGTPSGKVTQKLTWNGKKFVRE